MPMTPPVLSRRTAGIIALVSAVLAVVLAVVAIIAISYAYPDSDVVWEGGDQSQQTVFVWVMNTLTTISDIASQAAALLLTAAVICGTYAVIPRRQGLPVPGATFPPPVGHPAMGVAPTVGEQYRDPSVPVSTPTPAPPATASGPAPMDPRAFQRPQERPDTSASVADHSDESTSGDASGELESADSTEPSVTTTPSEAPDSPDPAEPSDSDTAIESTDPEGDSAR